MQTYEHYTIWDYGQNTERLYRSIHLMAREIYLTVHDVQAGTKSHHRYSAFFKSNIYKDFIGTLLHMIVYGLPAQVHPLRPLLHGYGIVNSSNITHVPWMPSPQLICATERTSTIFRIPYDVLAYCDEYRKYTFVVKLRAYLVICPSFWRTRVNPNHRLSRCPTVKDNQFEGSDYSLRNGILREDGTPRLTVLRHYALLYEIMYYYLQRLNLTSDTDPKETDDWNECVALHPEDS